MQKYRYQSLRNGLVGHWRPSRGPTGNTLIDTIRGNHGTLTNGTVWTASGGNGGYGTSLSFDGTDDYVDLPAIASPTAFPLTMCGWFRTTSITLTQCIFSFGHPTLTDRYIGIFAGGATAGDPVQLITRNSGTSTASTSTGYSANTWTFACGVIYSNTDKRAYINGGSEGTDSTNVTVPSTSINSIGRLFRGSAANICIGQIDSCCLFNRALSPGEILTLYQGGRNALDQTINVPIVRGATLGGITGSASQTELDDISSATGSLSLNATVSQTELDDTVTQTGSTTISGSASQTELDDTVSQTASLTITGSANQTELDDISSESGTILISAVVDQLELDDLVNQTGTVGDNLYGEANQLELDDTSTSTGSLSLNLSGSQLELPDTQTATASITVQASVSQTELSDISVATASITIRGSASQTELNDITLATGTQEEQSPIPRLTITSFTESTQAALSITRTSAILVITNTKQS